MKKDQARGSEMERDASRVGISTEQPFFVVVPLSRTWWRFLQGKVAKPYFGGDRATHSRSSSVKIFPGSHSSGEDAILSSPGSGWSSGRRIAPGQRFRIILKQLGILTTSRNFGVPFAASANRQFLPREVGLPVSAACWG